MPEHSTTFAIERAAFLYAERGASLSVVLEAYLRNPLGYVFKRPDFLLLARPCQRADADRWLAIGEAQDAWYVHLLVGGNVAAALQEMPYRLPFCCWHREWRADGGRLHVFPTDTLIRKTRGSIHHGFNHRPSTRAA